MGVMRNKMINELEREFNIKNLRQSWFNKLKSKYYKGLKLVVMRLKSLVKIFEKLVACFFA